MNGQMALVGIVGFLCGILGASHGAASWPLISFCAVLGFVCIVIRFTQKQILFTAASVFFFLAALGMARVAIAPSSLPGVFVPYLEQNVSLEGVIVADPDIRETSQRVTIEIEKDGVKTRVLAVADMYPPVHFGERVAVSGMVVLPEPFSTDGGRTFRYDTFLAKESIFALVERASLTVLSPREGFNHVLGFFIDLKRWGIEALARALPEPHASLASGLILGGKQGLGAALLNDFITSGLIHIVVLSGYNVMIVAEFVMRLFGRMPRRVGASIGALTILGFVLAAGAGAASIRAGLMAAIALYARATGRTYDAFRALLVAGVLMVLMNPLVLAFDPGFQLSFVATLGLIFGVPIVEKYLSFVKVLFLREVIASTIAAQIAVLPLLLYQNGLFSIVALPANVLVLPLVPLAMLFSAVALLAGSIVPLLAPLIGFPAYLLLGYIIAIVETAARIPLAAVSIPVFPFAIVVLAYLLLGYGVMRSLKNAPQ